MTPKQQELELDSSTDSPASPPAGKDTGDAEDSLDLGNGPFKTLVDKNFMQYASYVICDRAIPHLNDGLKPVQRRILHSLWERDDGRFIKVASVVGHAMQYHPHGDAAIANALVNLTNKRYLIEGQGNFGNIYTGDSAAASRYIECRLTELARNELFNEKLTSFVASYDGRNKEPVALPCKLPLLLMLGAEGIAVGLATRILPHNFIELLEAQIAIIKKKPFRLFPDFVQGGLMDTAEYDDGRGKVRVRAVLTKKDDTTLVVTELPAGTTSESLLASIEEAVRKKKVPVSSITDYTAESVAIELNLPADTNINKAIDSLYAFTLCETSAASRIVTIHNGRPQEMTVSSILEHNTQRLLKLLKQQLSLRKRELTEELHAKTLVQLFIENRIYKKIESCKSAEAVRDAIVTGLAPFREKLQRDIGKTDIEMLLNIRIRRISQFDIDKNRRDMEAIVENLAAVQKDLKELAPYATRYLRRLIKKYADTYTRRTKIQRFDEIEVTALTAEELEICYDKKSGYIGHAVKGESVLHCSSQDKLIVVWKDARYKMVQPPDKMFIGTDFVYLARFDRDRVMTIVSTQDGFTHVKRFAFGGTILNREYQCAPKGSKVLLFSDEDVEEFYIGYAPRKGQRVHQQLCRPTSVPVKGVRAVGNQVTSKKIAKTATRKPRWWKDKPDDDG